MVYLTRVAICARDALLPFSWLFAIERYLYPSIRTLLRPALLLVLVCCAGIFPASPALASASALHAPAITSADLSFSPPDPDLQPPGSRGQPRILTPAEISRLSLPDLRTLLPGDLEIVLLQDGSRQLRLSNTIWNSGTGALELEGEVNPQTRMTRVVQNVHARAGAPLAHLVGEFVWHPTHDHWHFAGFSIYELWTLAPSGTLDEIASSSDKVSYCVIDTDIIDRQNLSFTPRRSYFGCGKALQGLSAGWGDTYKSFLDGQEIHLAGIEDGYYALKSTTNPDANLLELNYENNTALIYLYIRGMHLEVIAPEELAGMRCLENGWC